MKIFSLRIAIMCLLAICGHDAIPDYWSGRTYTMYNGTQVSPVPFTLLSEIVEYNIAGSPRDAFLKTNLDSYTPIDLWDETNEPPSDRVGTLHKVVLEKGFVTRMEVLDQQGYDGQGNVPVLISTSWYKEKTTESIDHDPYWLEEAVSTDTLLNISMVTGWGILGAVEQAKIAKNRYWEIGEPGRYNDVVWTLYGRWYDVVAMLF